MHVVELVNVYKRFGRVEALRGVTLSVPRGVLAGLVGPNGAGKTTTFRLIMGFARPSSGEVRVWGMDPWRRQVEVRRRIGFLPERPVYPRRVAVAHLLRHLARLRGLGRDEVLRVARLVGIERLLDRSVASLSRGYLQRLGLAQALLGDPELLLLDEPTANLDPGARAEILRLIRDLGRELGVTVIIASHILPELQEVVNHLILISQGVVVDSGSLEELSRRYGVSSVYRVCGAEPRALAARLIALDGVEGVMLRGGCLDLYVSPLRVSEVRRVLEEMAAGGLVRRFEYLTASLGELYARAVGAS